MSASDASTNEAYVHEELEEGSLLYNIHEIDNPIK